MKPSDIGNCKDCKYSQVVAAEDSAFLKCFRFPPQCTSDPRPTVDPHGWCGEYKS